MSLKEVERAGLAALSRELGAVGLIRFLQLFETGYGDYTTERHQWLDDQSLDEVLARIKASRRTEE
ncbi:MAG: hypothetical protein IAE79_02245 [Anaerolinea sp.]|nr:hypothetical protein [Anaerolinea sp.]